MENSPFLDPRFLLPAVLATIAGIVWLARLESGLKETKKELLETQNELKVLSSQVEVHRSNPNIHFDIRVAEQVDKRQEQRFHTLETQIGDVRSDLKDIKQTLTRMSK